jgi:hypothetical protein
MNRLGLRRPGSMLVTKRGKLVRRSFAISPSASKNGGSRQTLVLRPATTTVHFLTKDLVRFRDFMACPRAIVARPAPAKLASHWQRCP